MSTTVWDESTGQMIEIPDLDSSGNPIPGTEIPGQGASATADPSIISPDYYRQKVVQFQQVLNDLAATGDNLVVLRSIANETGDAQMLADVADLEDKYYSLRLQFGTMAEAINVASTGINAVGINFPSVDAGQLGAIPALIGVAGIVAGAVALMYTAQQFFAYLQDVTARWQTYHAIEALPPDQRAAAQAAFRKTEIEAAKAKRETESGPLGQLAKLAKWGVIGIGLWFGYKLFLEHQRD